MKKLYLFIFIAAMFMGKIKVDAQVLGYPGATWMFSSTGIWAVCFPVNEKWEYVQDTTILGVNVKDIRMTRKTIYPPPFPSIITNIGHQYFHVNGDTVSLFVGADSSWQEVYNFSLQTGDSTLNPLGNRLNGFAGFCPDSVPYNDQSVVIDHGTMMIDGQSLRYYTVQYKTGNDTNTAFQTIVERVITFNYWHPNDSYWCGAIAECMIPNLNCYKDNGMMTDSLCADLMWFETLSLNGVDDAEFNLYPNPVADMLWIQTNAMAPNMYDIITMDGKLVLSNLQSPINISTLPSGIYFLTNQNRNVYRKFIKS